MKSQNIHDNSDECECETNEPLLNDEEVSMSAKWEVLPHLSLGVTFASNRGVGGSNPCKNLDS